MKSPLRYPGGKTRAIKYLKDFIPPDTTMLVSPFFGGGSFELYCLSQGITIYASDIYDPLVTFWQTLLTQTDDLINKLQTYLPIVTKQQYIQMQETIAILERPLDIATYFFILNRCSFSGNIAGGYTSYHIASKGENPRFNKASIERLKQFKNVKNLFIDWASFEITLNNYPYLFTYIDPPYVIKNKIYGSRGDNIHNIDHELLHYLLSQRKSPWLLSYNNCEYIRDLYKEYKIIDNIEWTYGMSKDSQSKELLILSPELEEALSNKNK